jgi:hypothetical protein
MGVGHALGLAGRAAGVADDEIILGIDGGIGIDGGLAREPGLVPRVVHQDMREVGQLAADGVDLGCVFFRNHDGPAAGMRQHMDVALAGIARIERHTHQIGDGCPQKKNGGFQRVVLDHADAVLGIEPQCQKPVGQAHPALPGLGEGEPAVAGRDRLAARVAARGAAHLRAHVHDFLPRFASQFPTA